MKNHINYTLLLLLVFSVNGFAQIKFEKGYFINNHGVKTECLIKNIDWRNNPINFEYRIIEDSKTQLGSIKQVSEFSIIGASKFIRAKVEIDFSSNILKDLSIYKEAKFETKELFLKELVTGSSSLYKYSQAGIYKYFFNKPNTEVKQLIYKQYLLNIENKVGKNEMYKQQLFNEVNCNATPIQKFVSIKYHERDLVKYFSEYNKCSGDKVVEKQQVKRNWFSLRVRPGISFSQLNVDHKYNKDVRFNKKTSFRFGAEAEFLLPFRGGKWGAFIEPAFQSYEDNKDINTTFSENVSVDYKFIELPIGLRYRFFIGDKTSVFMNVGYLIIYSLNSKIDYKNDVYVYGENDVTIKSRNGMVAGLGIELFDKIGVEYRFSSKRDLSTQYSNYISTYNTSSVILSYKLF